MNVCFDRLEGDVAVCVGEDGGVVRLSWTQLPAGAREGDWLTQSGGEWQLDPEQTARAAARIREKMDKLWRKP